MSSASSSRRFPSPKSVIPCLRAGILRFLKNGASTLTGSGRGKAPCCCGRRRGVTSSRASRPRRSCRAYQGPITIRMSWAGKSGRPRAASSCPSPTPGAPSAAPGHAPLPRRGRAARRQGRLGVPVHVTVARFGGLFLCRAPRPAAGKTASAVKEARRSPFPRPWRAGRLRRLGVCGGIVRRGARIPGSQDGRRDGLPARGGPFSADSAPGSTYFNA